MAVQTSLPISCLAPVVEAAATRLAGSQLSNVRASNPYVRVNIAFDYVKCGFFVKRLTVLGKMHVAFGIFGFEMKGLGQSVMLSIFWA